MRQRRALSWLIARAKTVCGVAAQIRTDGVDAALVGCEADDLTREERVFVEAIARNPLHRFTTWLDWQFYRVNRFLGLIPSPRTEEAEIEAKTEAEAPGKQDAKQSNPWW